MSETVTLKASSRDVVGKANRKLAAVGVLPAVLYGPGRDPQALALDRHEFEMLLLHHSANALIELGIDDKKKAVNAVIKSVQSDPVKGTIQHVDLYAVRMDRVIQTTVPVNFVGTSAGEKSGGVMMHNIREVVVECLPGDLPERLDIDVSHLEVGDNLHVSDIPAPDGVTIMGDGEQVLASVTAPTLEPVEVEEVLEAEEPELVGEAAEEEEAAE